MHFKDARFDFLIKRSFPRNIFFLIVINCNSRLFFFFFLMTHKLLSNRPILFMTSHTKKRSTVLLRLRLPWGSAMIVCSLLFRSRKRETRDVMYTQADHCSCRNVHGLSDTKWHSHGHVLATFKRHFFFKQTRKRNRSK